MDITDIYHKKNNSYQEIIRQLLSTYYYLLINDKFDDYTTYLTDMQEYASFFKKTFIDDENMLFFTLYNQLPSQFLPLKKNQYYLYPLMSFSNKINKPTFIDYNILGKNNNKHIIHVDKFWSSYNRQTYEKNKINFSLKTYNSLKLASVKQLYDNKTYIFNINSINNELMKNKTLFLFYKKPIITNNFKLQNNILKVNNEPIKLNDIKYLAIYKEMTRYDLMNCFNKIILPKNSILYNQKELTQFIEEKKVEIKIPNYYTLKKNRILDPLYNYESEQYVINTFNTIENIELLDLSYNNYLFNDITKKLYNINHINNYDCMLVNDVKIKICDLPILDPTKNIFDNNYNLKNGLRLLIWKNLTYIDARTGFKSFLHHFNIEGYFNIMSIVINKNNKHKLLGEEIYIFNTQKIYASDNKYKTYNVSTEKDDIYL